MKQFLPLLLTFIFLPFLVNAQTPGSFSYQAVVRNDQGQPVANQQVSVRISLLRGTATGQVIYSEEHSPTTNSMGKVSLKIGRGTEITGTFSSIDWSNGPYFMKMELDEKGGSNYKNMGTSQLLSVPYALQAKKAENTFSGNYHDLQNVPDTDSLVDTSDFLTSETDPVFDTSLAAGITKQDTAEWNKSQPSYWQKQAGALQYTEKFVQIGSDTTNEVDLLLRSNEDDSPGNSNISLAGNTSTLNLFATGADPKHTSLNFRMGDTTAYLDYLSPMKLLRLGQKNNNSTLYKGLNILYNNDVGIDTLPDEQLHVNGAVRVEDTTSSPKPKTVYGNSMPLAYGYIEPTGVQQGSYGIEQAGLTDDGQYKVYLKNTWKGHPIVNITPRGNYPGDDYSATYKVSASNEITVYLVDSDLNPLNIGFSIVVYGKPQ